MRVDVYDGGVVKDSLWVWFFLVLFLRHILRGVKQKLQHLQEHSGNIRTEGWWSPRTSLSKWWEGGRADEDASLPWDCATPWQ